MRIENIDIISPALFPEENRSEAEIFGSLTWLWLNDEHHCVAPITKMAAQILPAIKNGQFALFVQNGQPIGYFSWALFNAEAEVDYVKKGPEKLLKNQHWQVGPKLWIIDWFAPMGHSQLMKKITLTYLFPDQCFRALYHKGGVVGAKVKTFKGKHVSVAEKNRWLAENPIEMTWW